MTITSNELNNIENFLANPINNDGFYEINYQNSESIDYLNCNYNTLLTEIQNGNLPILHGKFLSELVYAPKDDHPYQVYFYGEQFPYQAQTSSDYLEYGGILN